MQTKFLVVQASSPYNAIMGRDWLHRMKAVPSTFHQKLRFPIVEEIMELNGDQVSAKQCVLATVRRKDPATEEHKEIGPEKEEVGPEKAPEKVFFDTFNPEIYFSIGSSLSSCDQENMIQILVENHDVFAWSVYEAPGATPDLACHVLSIMPNHRLIV